MSEQTDERDRAAYNIAEALDYGGNFEPLKCSGNIIELTYRNVVYTVTVCRKRSQSPRGKS